jgi:exodeoxyribonuclease VII large subunit
MEPELPHIYTVSSLTREIREHLETHFPLVWVSGEVSNLRRPVSGHYYFTLKDAEAQLRAVLFKGNHQHLRYKPEEGGQILCRGRITVYEPRGDYQLIVDYLEPAGLGALAQAFEALKTRLAAEGLFDQAHKQPLPFLPRGLALVTSPTGAVVRDILRLLQRRFPNVQVFIYPVKVQGAEAAGEIVRALEDLPEYPGVEVIVLARGGGSLEDLWPFNEEMVARAIYHCPLPVVSAIGHEVDFTIADFVADVRAPTPSAAVELVVPDKVELTRRLERFGASLYRGWRRHLDGEPALYPAPGVTEPAPAPDPLPPAASESPAGHQRWAATSGAVDPAPGLELAPGSGDAAPPCGLLRQPLAQTRPHGHPSAGLCRGHAGTGGDCHPGCGPGATESRHQSKGGQRFSGL